MIVINHELISPICCSIFGIDIYWYGVSYFLGFLIAYIILYYRKHSLRITSSALDDMFLYLGIGVIFGGTIGYQLFYSPSNIISDPLSLITFWRPGRSFHGGLIGVILGIYFFARKHRQPFWVVMDFIAPVVPIAIGLGRLGNFINGELWGKPAAYGIGVIFSHVDNIPRYPSQIYEALTEGLLLGIVLNLMAKNQQKYPYGSKKLSAMFLIGYGIARFACEFLREPDRHIGYITSLNLTTGQILSLPMILLGYIIFKSSKNASLYTKNFR